MDYMRHDAIVVTSWNIEAIEEAAAKAREFAWSAEELESIRVTEQAALALLEK